MENKGDIGALLEVVRRLLAEDGCPWDRAQTPLSLRSYLLEEAYEVADAIAEGDPEHHREELGDLLFQIVFQAELAGLSPEEIAATAAAKLVRRHPHVFGEERVEDAEQVAVSWERIKQRERGTQGGVLDGVPRSMPALRRCQKLSERAAKVGFDWPDLSSVREKTMEELGELDDAIAAGERTALEHELGDLLFAVTNWARKLGLDAEDQLAAANRRFEARFAHIERDLARRGQSITESSLEEMDRLWNEAKALEKGERS